MFRESKTRVFEVAFKSGIATNQQNLHYEISHKWVEQIQNRPEQC